MVEGGGAGGRRGRIIEMAGAKPADFSAPPSFDDEGRVGVSDRSPFSPWTTEKGVRDPFVVGFEASAGESIRVVVAVAGGGGGGGGGKVDEADANPIPPGAKISSDSPPMMASKSSSSSLAAAMRAAREGGLKPFPPAVLNPSKAGRGGAGEDVRLVGREGPWEKGSWDESERNRELAGSRGRERKDASKERTFESSP